VPDIIPEAETPKSDTAIAVLVGIIALAAGILIPIIDHLKSAFKA